MNMSRCGDFCFDCLSAELTGFQNQVFAGTRSNKHLSSSRAVFYFLFFCQPEAWASHRSYWEAFQCSTMLRATLVGACNRLIWPAVCDGLLTFAGKSQEYHVSRKLTDSICNINRYFAVPGWNWLLMHFIYKERDICLRSTNTVALEIILQAESKGRNLKRFGTP